MIIKQRMSLVEKILLTIVMIILTVGVVGMAVATLWLSGRDLSFLFGR